MFSHQTHPFYVLIHQEAAGLCQSIHVNQSQHRTRQLIFKPQMDHHQPTLTTLEH